MALGDGIVVRDKKSIGSIPGLQFGQLHRKQCLSLRWTHGRYGLGWKMVSLLDLRHLVGYMA